MSLFDNLTAPSSLSPSMVLSTPKIAVVIPCYQVERTILSVLTEIGPEVQHIFCVDEIGRASGRERV